MNDWDHRPAHRLVPRAQPDRSEPTLFDDVPEDDSIDGRFLRFHRDNPQVYEALRRFAFEAWTAGAKIGMKALWERLRWQQEVETRGDKVFRLNNIYTSRYARLLMESEPELAGMFETRELKS